MLCSIRLALFAHSTLRTAVGQLYITIGILRSRCRNLQIRDALMARARDFKIELDDVSITHLSFSREYTAAIEAKQVAQQDSERAKYVVMKAVQEKVRHVCTHRVAQTGAMRFAACIQRRVHTKPLPGLSVGASSWQWSLSLQYSCFVDRSLYLLCCTICFSCTIRKCNCWQLVNHLGSAVGSDSLNCINPCAHAHNLTDEHCAES